MLDDIIGSARAAAMATSTQVEHESAARGTLLSSGTPIIMEQRLTPIHEAALVDTMRLIVQFSERTGIPIPELSEMARSKLVTFTSDITVRLVNATNRMQPNQLLSQTHDRFNRRVENALRDVEIGFIQGRSAIVTENSTNQSKALRLLRALYDATRARTEPVFIEELNTGLSEEDAKAAWRYLRDRRLIDTFNIDYTARINGAGIDAIEGAQRRPDQPSANFPSVSYNIVYNTMHVGAMSNSPVQQGGVHSTQNQTVSYPPQDLADLNRLVTELTLHLGELQIDARQRQKAEAQIATMKAQLTDEPARSSDYQTSREIAPQRHRRRHRKPARHGRTTYCLGLGTRDHAQIVRISHHRARPRVFNIVATMKKLKAFIAESVSPEEFYNRDWEGHVAEEIVRLLGGKA
ncbi:MAG: hypothetical protein WBR26_04880 [Candidatus Acidiferrum sp.]